MSKRTCLSCGGPIKGAVTICNRCERATSRHLGDMEAHRAELEVTLTRQARLTAASGGSRSANTPLVYQESASDVLAAQRAILVSWSRLVHDEISDTWPVSDTIGAMALYIEEHLRELRKHEAGGELVDEIAQMVHRIVTCIDRPEDRQRIHVAPCIIILDGTRCPGELILHTPHEGRQYVDCRVCGTRWEPEQFNRLGKRIGTTLAPASGTVQQVAAMYQLADKTVYRWIAEGRLARDDNGAVLLDQVDAVMTATRRTVADVA